MQNQIIEQLTATTSKSYETMKSLGDINSSALRKITDLQFDFISMNVESGIEQAKSLNSQKDAKDIFASSVEFVTDYNEKVIGYTSQTVEILTKTGGEAKTLFEKIFASKASAKKPAKAKTTKAASTKPASKKVTRKEV